MAIDSEQARGVELWPYCAGKLRFEREPGNQRLDFVNDGHHHRELRPRSPLASAAPSRVPGVSIIRPLKGLDTNLYENLESTFTQEYPNFEIFLAVASEHDQALSVVRELVSKYPNVNAHIIIGMLVYVQ